MPSETTVIRLPLHLKWSGPREYNLSDPQQRRRVYEIVLREGRAPDVRKYIDPDELLRMWTDIVLPEGVRAAWADYFSRNCGVRLNKEPESRTGA